MIFFLKKAMSYLEDELILVFRESGVPASHYLHGAHVRLRQFHGRSQQVPVTVTFPYFLSHTL
jgi:hypothetical protein